MGNAESDTEGEIPLLSKFVGCSGGSCKAAIKEEINSCVQV